MNRLTIHSLAALAAVAIAAAALVPLASAHDQRTRAATTTIPIAGGEFFFRLSTKSIAKPGTVRFVFKNTGHVVHDFAISGKTTPLIQPGKTATLVVSFTRKGAFPYICTVPGHAAAGMKGVFTVR